MSRKQRATTVRGARRVLANAKRNHERAMEQDVPAWVRAATAARVRAAEAEIEQLQEQEGSAGDG
jgi:ribosomal protein L39E